jgi:predicted MFS family arabinose efflux permease
LAATLFLVPRAPTPLVATLLGGLSMLGGGALYALLFGEVAARLARDRVGAASGLCASAQSLAHVVAAPLVGRSIDRAHGSYAPAMMTLAAIVIPGALAWILWPANDRCDRARVAPRA